MNLYLNLFDQYRQNACPEYLWIRHAKELKSLSPLPGFKRFRQIDPGFEELFVEIEAMTHLPTHGPPGLKIPGSNGR